MSVYKQFRSSERTADLNTLSKRFDQPTYVSFKLVFADGRDSWYNGGQVQLNFDRMPHPLFGIRGLDDVYERETYSAIDFLRDNNEPTRAQMLEEFIIKFNTLQENYQWYFQKVEGIGDLLKIDPKKGMRITSDKRLTISTLEAVDLRMSHLMNMYRKIAWDDTYQRWALPDMMRYFTLKIYISEFRTFHTPNQYDGMGNATSVYDSNGELYLNLLDDILPTWVILCEMCEFDLENIGFNYLNSIDVGKPEEAVLNFGIKVGKIYETQIYPMFKNMYLVDKKLNGFDRSKILTPAKVLYTKDEKGYRIDAPEITFNSTTREENVLYPTSLSIAQNLHTQQKEHKVGDPFNQSMGPNLPEDLISLKISPLDPDTWIGNALSFGRAFVRNIVEQKVDKLKMTPIPGLGFSFNEAVAAIQSKDIITALGLIRKAVFSVTEGYVGPSQNLGDKITDDAFRSFLLGVSKSEATTDLQLEVQRAANLALNDAGIWKEIKDYSMATDLIGLDEENIKNTIENKTTYQDTIKKQTDGVISTATTAAKELEKNILERAPETRL